MREYKGNLCTRSDTFFGVCQGIGEDTGIPPNLLRIAFALMLFFNPIAVLTTYFAAGIAVLAVRLISPDPRSRRQVRRNARSVEPEPALVEPEAQVELAKAA